jgi:hypothetical protein
MTRRPMASTRDIPLILYKNFQFIDWLFGPVIYYLHHKYIHSYNVYIQPLPNVPIKFYSIT